MTPLLSSATAHAAPVLDYDTANTVRQLAVSALEGLVCKWEQQSADAASSGDNRAAQQYSDWAFAVQMARYDVINVICSAVLDSLNPPSVVQERRRVELPNLNRSPKDLALDVLATEVVSEMPEPC